jgi:hypothetical protein
MKTVVFIVMVWYLPYRYIQPSSSRWPLWFEICRRYQNSNNNLENLHFVGFYYTRLFISPSWISDPSGTVAGMVTPKRSMSTEERHSKFLSYLTGARYVHPWWRGRCQSCNQVPATRVRGRKSRKDLWIILYNYITMHGGKT